MKFLSVLVALTALVAKVSAHYTLPALIVGGAATGTWEYVRQTNNFNSLDPVTDVTSDDIRCYTSLESDTASTATVAAGSTVGFTAPITLYHPGVLNVYMAQAPAGTDVASWDGSGDVWFRIYQITADTNGGTSITFPSQNLAQVTFPIPAETPSGQYLIRVEHIALHVASTFGGAQFYLSCAQVEVWQPDSHNSGGTGTPGPLVSFPGAYTVPPPNLLSGNYRINIYDPIPATYTQPGPALWPAAGGVSALLPRLPSPQ
ncbi:glycosyl hydrolase family 61-domain-containing protein [Mycena haematopus]|nr:glycosyl hydrolase family 61-domain-containing protein [Mycena haematopus]